ncbi:helix-turn-helix domain-containing protein [Tissierella carlieri]
MSDNNAIMEEEIINVLGNYNKFIQNIPVDDSLKPKSIIDDFHNWERDRVLDALIKNNGNKTLTAKSLGISRSRLYRLLEKY